MICPYCGQDAVNEAKIHPDDNNTLIKTQICFECDTVWVDGEEVIDGMGINFVDFMNNRALPVDWSLVKKV